MRTELDAINSLLASIGESKVTSTDTPLLEVDIAKTLLTDVLVEVLGSGWHFNRDEGVQLVPDSNGYIYLPPTTLKAETAYKSDGTALKERKKMLYDAKNQTYVIAETVSVDIYTFLDIDEVPTPCYTYVLNMATYRYQKQMLDSGDSRIATTAQLIKQSKAELESYDGSSGSYNIYNNPEMAEQIYGR